MPTPPPGGGTVVPITPDPVTRVYTAARDITGEPISYGYKTGWWSWTADTDGAMTVETASTWGTYIAVLADDASTFLGDSATASAPVTVAVTSGTFYYVLVQTFTSDADITADLTITVTAPVLVDPDAPGPPPEDSVPPDIDLTASRLIWVNNDTYSAPTMTDGVPDGWSKTDGTDTVWGFLSVAVAGVDVTLFRGAPIQIGTYELAEPWGYGAASFSLPAVAGFETPGTGVLAFLTLGADVLIRRVLQDGTTATTTTYIRWAGVITGWTSQLTEQGTVWTVQCTGLPGTLALQQHRPKPYQPAVDVGALVAAAVNTSWSRRVASMASATTGIVSRYAGAWQQTILDYVTDLTGRFGGELDGDQWTIRRHTTDYRGLRVALKDRTTTHWTVRTGQQGLAISLRTDVASAPNVIRGHGVNADGYAWAGWRYPGAAQSLTYKPYPMTTGGLITVGTDDGDTTSGTGVSDAQEAMNGLTLRGLADVPIDGVWNTQDANALKVVQRDAGITIDGILGPQSWATLFPQYPRTFLDSATRFPLAARTQVQRYTYYPDGSVKGTNPAYVPSVLPVTVDYDFGPGVTKADAIRAAQSELARVPAPGLIGELVLHGCDPVEGSRFDIREGENVRVLGYEGGSPLLHVSQVLVEPTTRTVRVTVDQWARDQAQVAAILGRDRETRDDPVKLSARRLRRSQIAQDNIVEFDGESAGGIVHPLALIGGLWVLVDVPVSQAGRVAKVELRTYSPAAKFTVAFFGDLAVTAANLVSYVGSNPLTARTDHYGPYDHQAKALEDLGFIQALGGPGQAAGYDHPGSGGSGYETSPHDGGTTTLTGWMRSTAGWSYRSTRPPFLRVAFWSPVTTTVKGRIWPAPLEV